jgi:competence protein ComEC
MEHGTKRSNIGAVLLFALLFLDAAVWWEIFSAERRESPELYFFEVGQGDATLLALPGEVEILTDAGPPGGRAAYELEAVKGFRDRVLELAIISHPQLDHFGGFYEVLSRYRVGAVLINGRSDAGDPVQWEALMNLVEEKRIPLLTVGAGDAVRYASTTITFLSPDEAWRKSAELNDTGLVEYIRTPSLRALLAADIGFGVEEYLLKKQNLRADILKVPHHGSKYSSGQTFLEAVRPKVAVVQVGEGNRYGHPTDEALNRLYAAEIKVFRTDKNGTVRVRVKDGKLQVFTER